MICTGNIPACFSGSTDYGIRTTPPPSSFLRNTRIKNGSVQGFDHDCINIQAGDFEILDLLISDCGSDGIRTDSSRSGRIERVHASENAQLSANVPSSMLVSDSTFYNNGFSGVNRGNCLATTCSENGTAISGPQQTCSVLPGANFWNTAICQ